MNACLLKAERLSRQEVLSYPLNETVWLFLLIA